MTAFAQRLDAFFAELFRLDPVRATDVGMHDHDGRWPDLTEAGRQERLAFADRWSAELSAVSAAGLDLDEQVDRDLLLLELDALRFAETDLREDAWDPLGWVYLLGDGFFPLLAREFAPLGDRLASVADRCEGLPAVVHAARAALVGLPDRPVSRLHAETALKQLPGVADLVDEALAAARDGASEPAVAAVRPRLEASAAGAKAALTAFETHLRDAVLPASDGEGRLGARLFAGKLRHTLKIADPSPDRVLARAEREYAAVRAEMIRLARSLWPTWCPDRAAPSDDGILVRGVLDAIATQHPAEDDLLRACRAELARIEAFCREADLIGLPDEPLDIRWTPKFLAAFGGAMLIPPGPLDKGQRSFFAITHSPEDWTPEQVESSLRETNDRMIRLLTIHEAVPGHYLQGAYANTCPSLARAAFWSGVYAEGWAVYVTQVMMDVGYGADDPALMLSHWKFYLRAVINAIIDARIHGAAMTEDEAVALMVDGGFQEEAEARNKYLRARLSSTHLSTYFVGSMEHWSIEAERRRRLAAASGDPRAEATVVEHDLPGGLGATPGFVYRAHLEAIVGHSAPPTSLLRRLVLGPSS